MKKSKKAKEAVITLTDGTQIVTKNYNRTLVNDGLVIVETNNGESVIFNKDSLWIMKVVNGGYPYGENEI